MLDLTSSALSRNPRSYLGFQRTAFERAYCYVPRRILRSSFARLRHVAYIKPNQRLGQASLLSCLSPACLHFLLTMSLLPVMSAVNSCMIGLLVLVTLCSQAFAFPAADGSRAAPPASSKNISAVGPTNRTQFVKDTQFKCRKFPQGELGYDSCLDAFRQFVRGDDDRRIRIGKKAAGNIIDLPWR